jgi:DNA-binding transcriptional regulator YhcF (GntR family)
MIRLKKGSPQPLYLQIKECLRREIAAGRYKADEAIPCERALADELGLNRLTVRRAIVELTREGLLERIPGRGTFLKNSPGAATVVADGGAPSARAMTIAVVAQFDRVDPQDSLFYYRILQGVHRVSDAQVSLVYRKIAEPYDKFVRELGREEGLDGLLVMSLVDQGLLRALQGLPLPTVFLDCARF